MGRSSGKTRASQHFVNLLFCAVAQKNIPPTIAGELEIPPLFEGVFRFPLFHRGDIRESGPAREVLKLG